MAQLKDLLVAGKSRFVGTTSFTDQMISLGGIRFLEGALEKKTAIYQVLGIDSSGVAVYADLTGLTIGTANRLSVSGGGTMQPVYFASGQPVTLPAFKNLSAVGPLEWVSNENDIMAITSNTLAYWNGAYKGTVSNITVLGKIQTGTWQATPIDAARGGTGQTSLVNSANVLINALSTGSSTPQDTDYYISQYVGGGTTTTTYHRRPMSALWTYIKGKIDTDHKYVLRAGDTMTGSLIINGADKDYGLIVRHIDNDNESLKIFNENSYTKFVSTNETTSGQIYFTLSNIDTANSGASKNSSDVIFKGSASGSEVVATKFTGALDGNAATATTASKLGTNAGSATRPVYFASGIPVQCNETLAVNISKNAATATLADAAKKLTYIDDRAENPNPIDMTTGLSIHLKSNSADGLSDGGSYHVALHMKNWSDYSGGPWSQLATTGNGNLWYRVSTDKDTWGTWYKTAIQNKANTFSGNNTFSGSNTFSGPATFTGEVTIDGMKNGYRHEWTASIKGATWSRLCYVAYANNVTGSSYILNIAATRNSVVYNDTYLVKPHHSKNGTIIKISGNKYSTGYKVRLLSDSGGNSYVELYDNCQSATASTTQSVYCRLIPIYTGAVTKYTAFTDGTTVPTDYSIVKTLTINNADIQADISGKNNIYYVTGNSTGTAGTWTGTNTQIPNLYTGLTIAYKIQLAGSSDGVTLNLTTAEGASGAKTVRRNDSALTTHLPAGSVVILTYDGTYWCWADYDANSYARVRQYSTATDGNYPLIFRYTNNNINSGSYVTEYLRFDSNNGLYVNPSTSTLGAQRVALKGSNPYMAFFDSTGAVQGYVQYVESSDSFSFGTNFANSLQITANGSLSIPASQTITPRTTDTGSVGTSALKWNKMYATTFHGDLDGNAKTATDATNATTASKLGTSAGSSTLPVYFTTGGIPAAVTNIEIVGTSTGGKSVKVTNTNGSVGIYTATNRGLYDFTKSAWIINTTTAGDHTYIPLWKSKGSSKLPVYFNSSGEPVACGDTLEVSITGNAATATMASTLAVNAGADGKPIYFTGGIPVAFAKTIGGAAKPVYVNAGTITECSSTVGSTTKPVYMNAGTITASNATVGSASRPMYLNAGTMTAVTAVGTAYGGTGNTSYNANRVIYTETATKMSSSNHFASSIKMAINSTTEPATTFHVEGSANVDGEFSLDSKVKFKYNSTDESLDFIFV